MYMRVSMYAAKYPRCKLKFKPTSKSSKLCDWTIKSTWIMWKVDIHLIILLIYLSTSWLSFGWAEPFAASPTLACLSSIWVG